MISKPKLSGALAEAFGRVERDLAILYGARYWTLDEWVKIDGLLHKGEYLFTNGPGKSLLDVDPPPTDAVQEAIHVPERGREPEDLLILEGDDSSVLPEGNEVPSKPSPMYLSSMQPPSQVPGEFLQMKQVAEAPLPPVAPSSPTKPDGKRATKLPSATEVPRTRVKNMHSNGSSAISGPGVQLTRPFTEGEKVNMLMEAQRPNYSQSSETKKVLQNDKGDLIELKRFIEGHRFFAKNIRTGESGYIHEEIFFPPPWLDTKEKLDQARIQAPLTNRQRESYPKRMDYPTLARAWEAHNGPDASKHTSTQDPSSPLGSPHPASKQTKQNTKKHLTCYFWKTKGLDGCRLSKRCPYAHHETGEIAPPPWMQPKESGSATLPKGHNRKWGNPEVRNPEVRNPEVRNPEVRNPEVRNPGAKSDAPKPQQNEVKIDPDLVW